MLAFKRAGTPLLVALSSSLSISLLTFTCSCNLHPLRQCRSQVCATTVGFHHQVTHGPWCRVAYGVERRVLWLRLDCKAPFG